MITAVVFSKDRACQLDLLLTSLERNGSGMFDVAVVYLPTTVDHLHGYWLCQSRFPGVRFLLDENDRVHLAANVFTDGHDYACFFTDDSVLYRKVIPSIFFGSKGLCFSLRLGENTTWCYPYARTQERPRFIKGRTVRAWEWPGADGDFGYPASVDGHVFRSGDLVTALNSCPERVNPNQIEEHLVKHFQNDTRTVMTSYPQSCLVGIPANIVTDTHRNRHAHGPTPDDLCASYLSGKRLDLDAMDFTDVRGAHQDIELVLA